MNPRVLELLKSPKQIKKEDLSLLKDEVNTFPYIQNIRALHLYGVHLFDKENYQKELSVTAAYTTDKKILYQLINGKIEQKNKRDPQVINQENKIEKEKVKEVKNTFQYVYKTNNFPLKRKDSQIISSKENISETLEDINLSDSIEDQFFASGSCQTQNIPFTVNYVYVNGERNRILFEGEEEFMNEVATSKEIALGTQNDIETQIVRSNVEDNTVGNNDASLENRESTSENNDIYLSEKETQFTSETIIDDAEISSGVAEEIIMEDGSELSFHATDAFLPSVKIASEQPEEAIKPEKTVQPCVNKHEEEMRRLIEEVEKKMKETKTSLSQGNESEPESQQNADISFADTQPFEIKKDEVKNEIDEAEEKPFENTAIFSETKDETSTEKAIFTESEQVKSVWRPMSVESHVPDSLLYKDQSPDLQNTVNNTHTRSDDQELSKALELNPDMPSDLQNTELYIDDYEVSEAEDKNETESPVMNVSFFGSDISSWQPGKGDLSDTENEKETSEKLKEESVDSIVSVVAQDSNIPGFINTWQSWLKIDRTEEVEKQKTQIKTKAIENFIENNPKISQLKDETSYVVKEKNVDISHLMTETLANLYTEQKLYTKAIKAFEVLIRKHPDRKSYFEEKIQEVKDIKTKS